MKTETRRVAIPAMLAVAAFAGLAFGAATLSASGRAIIGEAVAETSRTALVFVDDVPCEPGSCTIVEKTREGGPPSAIRHLR